MAETAQSTQSAPNASAAPPGQTIALSMLNKASVKTGSRRSGLVDTRRKYKAFCEDGEELPVDASETYELRRARDGNKYTRAEFIDFWGETRGQVLWEDAGDTQERRRARDGIIYTKEEFLKSCGKKRGQFLWEDADGRSLTPDPSEQVESSNPFPFLLPSEEKTHQQWYCQGIQVMRPVETVSRMETRAQQS